MYKKIQFTNSLYEGDTIRGIPHGKGKYVFHDGTIYDGEVLLNKLSGLAKVTYKNNTVINGLFVNGGAFG